MSVVGQNSSIFVKKFQHIFQRLGQKRLVTVCMFVFFFAKILFWEICIYGLIIFPDSKPQIGQQNFFIIWPAGQTLNQLFFTDVQPNG